MTLQAVLLCSLELAMPQRVGPKMPPVHLIQPGWLHKVRVIRAASLDSGEKLPALIKILTPEALIIIGETGLSIGGHVNVESTCPKPRKYHIKTTKTKTTTSTGALRAPVGRGRRPKAAPLLSSSNVVVLWLRTCILRTSVGLWTSKSWKRGPKWCDSPADTPNG